MEISACVKYVGVNDHQVDLFEGQYKVPNGMSYNSYVILDDKNRRYGHSGWLFYRRMAEQCGTGS